MTDKQVLLELTSDIVAAYVGNNPLAASDLPKLMQSVFNELEDLSVSDRSEEVEPPTPAVPVKDSISPSSLTCLEDGKSYKSLKRHLRTAHDMSPEEYREKWGLAHDYPMVAPNYAKARSKLAKKMGLGRKAGK